MIRRQVSAALLVRDGFTGCPLSAGGGTLCAVDGQPWSPVWKAGGFLVLTDLPPGEHTVTLRRWGYLEQTISVPVAGGRAWEGWTCLRPGPGYAFPAGAARVELTLDGGKAGGTALWIAPDGGGRLKLAQERVRAGDREVRVFCSGVRLPVPGDFLIADRKNPEITAVECIREGRAILARPLAHSHSRGNELMFARPYRADEDGRVCCVMRESGKLWILREGGLSVVEVQPGENRLSL